MSPNANKESRRETDFPPLTIFFLRDSYIRLTIQRVSSIAYTPANVWGCRISSSQEVHLYQMVITFKLVIILVIILKSFFYIS